MSTKQQIDTYKLVYHPIILELYTGKPLRYPKIRKEEAGECVYQAIFRKIYDDKHSHRAILYEYNINDLL